MTGKRWERPTTWSAIGAGFTALGVFGASAGLALEFSPRAKFSFVAFGLVCTAVGTLFNSLGNVFARLGGVEAGEVATSQTKALAGHIDQVADPARPNPVLNASETVAEVTTIEENGAI